MTNPLYVIKKEKRQEDPCVIFFISIFRDLSRQKKLNLITEF